MRYLYIALLYVAFAVSSQALVFEAHAEEVGAEMKEVSLQNPHLEPLYKYANELIDGLKKEDLQVIYEIRNSFGTTRSIRVVHGDVSKAIGLCAKENEELKEELETRFDSWEKAVMGSLEQVENKMEERR